jgi:hypothetical protein
MFDAFNIEFPLEYARVHVILGLRTKNLWRLSLFLDFANNLELFFFFFLGGGVIGDVNSISVGSGTNIQDNSLVHVAKSNLSGKVLPTIIGDNVTVGEHYGEGHVFDFYQLGGHMCDACKICSIH